MKSLELFGRAWQIRTADQRIKSALRAPFAVRTHSSLIVRAIRTIGILSAITGSFCLQPALANGTPFSNYTVEFERSPNLPEGCPHYIGPGCELSSSPLPPLTAQGCFANEVWADNFCAWPKMVTWIKPHDLPHGCATRNGPGCEIPGQPPLTAEGCFANERFINFVADQPAAGGMCMIRLGAIRADSQKSHENYGRPLNTREK